MPLRSTGCFRCRQRKIRCSEERPGCQRCATHGVVCPGYKTIAGGVEFRDQTSETLLRIQVKGKRENDHHRRSGKTGSDRTGRNELPVATALTWTDATPDVIPRKQRQGACAKRVPAAINATTALPLTSIRSPAANRVALYHSFMQLYLPHNILPHERGLWLSHFEYMSMLVTTANCPAHLSHALDAVSLVQVGSIRREKRVLHKAIESYTKALRSLAFAISNPKSVHNDTVLAAATLLSMAEFYTEFRLRGQTWIGHQQGMQKLIEARGPDSILASPLALHLFYQSTSSSMAMSLLLRKENVYTRDVWRDVKAKAALLDDYSESYRLGNRLPGLLERHDSLDSEDSDLLAKIDALLVDLGELEVEMKECLVNLHTQSAASDQSWFALIDVKHFQPYAELVTDRTMTRAFQFPSFMTGHLHSSHWLRMYLLRDATRSLHKQRRALVHDWAPESDDLVPEKELLSYILDLCRSIPCFVEPLNGAIGEMCSFFPLFVAEQYFRANSHWRWARWVHHVSGRIFQKGMSMPFPTADPSLLPLDTEESLDYQASFNLVETPSVPQSPSSSARGSPRDRSLTSSVSGS